MKICNKDFKYAMFVTLLVVGLGACGGAEERAQKYLERANSHYEEENYEKARVEVKNVLQINPKNSDALYLMGMIQKEEEEYRQAYASFNSAINEDKSNVGARNELANFLLMGENIDEAKGHVDRVLEIDPSNLMARGLKATILSLEGDHEGALTLAREILAVDEADARAVAVLATDLLKSEKVDEALTVLDKALSKEESSAIYRMKIGVLSRFDRREEVKRAYLSLIEFEPENLKNYDILAAIYASEGSVEDVKRTLNLAIQNNHEDVDSRLSLVSYLAKVVSNEEAVAVVNGYIDQFPDEYRYKIVLTRLYINNGQRELGKGVLTAVVDENRLTGVALKARVDLAKIALEEKNETDAERLIEEVLETEPSNHDALVLRSKLDLKSDDVKSAIANLRAALKANAKSIEALKLLAYAQERDGALNLAFDTYAQLVDIDNTDIHALVNAGRLSLASEKSTELAQKYLERANSLEPLNVEAASLLYTVYKDSSDWNSALQLAEPFTKTQDVSIKALGKVLYGGVYASQEKWNDAQKSFKEAIDLYPLSIEAVAGYVDSLVKDSKESEATAFLEGHLKNQPQMLNAKKLLAALYMKEGKAENAERLYKEVMVEQPDVEDNYSKLAVLYIVNKQREKAEDIYSKGIAHNGGFYTLRLQLASLYISSGELDQAREQYEAIYSENPDLKVVKNNLAILLVNSFNTEANVNRAADMVVDLEDADNPNYLDTMGWVHYHKGHYSQAISYIQSALQMEDKPEFRYHLGMAFNKIGQKEDAQRELSLAAEHASDTAEWLASAEAVLNTL